MNLVKFNRKYRGVHQELEEFILDYGGETVWPAGVMRLAQDLRRTVENLEKLCDAYEGGKDDRR